MEEGRALDKMEEDNDLKNDLEEEFEYYDRLRKKRAWDIDNEEKI